MPTPICHRTLGPSAYPPHYFIQRSATSNEDIERLTRDAPGEITTIGPTCAPVLLPEPAMGRPCIGSACALWVPQMRTVYPATGYTYEEPTGVGYCADNATVRRPDPAMPTKPEGK